MIGFRYPTPARRSCISVACLAVYAAVCAGDLKWAPFWTQQHKRCPDQREPSSGHGEPHGAAHVQLPVGRGKGRGVKNPPKKTSKSLCHCFYISGRAVALVQGWVGRHEMARSDR